jgi:cellulose synthase/poly-beta-1,6-N-acetylglucosamine synthase-like glycosyltransferase
MSPPYPPHSTTVSQAPLVTFALFAYNQEKFIREAVEGAFAQTYEPLEIILSDDYSTDLTFEIMQEMAAAYRGPHRVLPVQTPHNLGVVQHVLLRGREAAGDIVVVAAGDDVSLPGRVASHVPCYADPKVCAVSTGFALINEASQQVDEGATILKGQIANRVRRGDPTYLRVVPADYTTIQGSTASYRKQVFSLVKIKGCMSYAEDQLFTFVIHALGLMVDYLPQPMLRYRIHTNALTNLPHGSREWRAEELKSARQLVAEIEKLQFFLEFTRVRGLEAVVDVPALQENLAALRGQEEWRTLSGTKRATSLLRDLLKGKARTMKWKLARVAGQFPDYWPKRSLARYQRKYRTR